MSMKEFLGINRHIVDGSTLLGVGLTVVSLRTELLGSIGFWFMVIGGFWFMFLGIYEFWTNVKEKLSEKQLLKV